MWCDRTPYAGAGAGAGAGGGALIFLDIINTYNENSF